MIHCKTVLSFSYSSARDQSNKRSGTKPEAQSSWAVSVMRYGAGVVSWTKTELQNVDRKTRKLMTLYGMLHPHGDVDRLYLPKAIGRRRLMGVEDCVRLEQNERLLKAVIPEGVLGSGKYQRPKEVKNRNCKKRFESWKSKPLHSQILRQTEDVRDKTSWNWISAKRRS